MGETQTAGAATAQAPPPSTSLQSIGARLLDSLGKLADGLITLRVTTAIGAVTGSNITEINERTTINFQADAKEIASTSINMLLGDCNTVLSQGFVDNQAFAQIHRNAVADARAIRADTIDMITKGIEAVRNMGKP